MRTAARVPFAETCEQFEELGGVRVGNHFSRETLNAVAEVATLGSVIPQKEEIDARIRLATVTSGSPPVLVVASDGAMTPTRPQAPRKTRRGRGRYREVKGGNHLSDRAEEAHHRVSAKGTLLRCKCQNPTPATALEPPLLPGSSWKQFRSSL